MDVTLPGMDGLAATRAIRAAENGALVPIIGVSGRAEARDIEAAHAAGMDAFLAKPVSPAVLAETLAGKMRPQLLKLGNMRKDFTTPVCFG